ncbi:MAG: hypothetical protein F4Y26_09450 [Gammaproteobacteria bacterium]|nr:hypothetical protein [Gammaproteobacteria bacterium]
MPRMRVLITVKTYPLPSQSYDELVCTAGVLEDGSWVRIYPVPMKSRPRSVLSCLRAGRSLVREYAARVRPSERGSSVQYVVGRGVGQARLGPVDEPPI